MDNLRLRKQEDDIKRIGRQIEELNEKLGGIDVRNLDRERKKLITQQDELIREVGHCGGRGVSGGEGEGQKEELNEKLGGIDVRNLDRERKKLITQQDELIREVGH